MNATVSVALQADVQVFQRNFNAAASTAEQVGATIGVVGANITRNVANINRANIGAFTRSLQEGTLSVTRLGQGVSTALPDLDRMRNITNRAGSSLTDFSRIIQDAPFGFIAIQNNLNPMLESFQRLTATTGSVGGAIRALGSQLIGAGGLGFAVAAVSSALVAYTQYSQRAAKATKEAEKTTDDYADSLNQLDRARLKGAQNAQKDIVQLETLYNATQNATLSYKTRKDAVDQLQKQYPEYFKNMKDEEILAGKADGAYKRLSQSIIATAKARAAQDIIAENSKKKLETEQKIADLEIDISKQKIEAAKIEKQANGAIGGGKSFAETKAAAAVGKQISAYNEQVKLKKEIADLDGKNLKLADEITSQMKAGADLAGKVGDVPKSTGKKLKSLADIMKELGIALQQNESTLGASFDDKQKGKVSAYQSAIDSLIKNGFDAGSEAVLGLQKTLGGLFTADVKKKADEFFNFTLPTRLAGEAATKVEAQKKAQGIALEKAAKDMQPIWEEFLSPDISSKLQKKQFELDFGKSNIDVEASRIKSAIELLSSSFDAGEISLDQFKDKYTKLSEEMKAVDLMGDLQNLASAGIADALTSSFSNIGESIVSGGDIIASAGEGVKKAFANLLSQLGQQFVTMGIAKMAAGILATPFGGAMVAQGAALVALGAGLSVGGGMVGAMGGKKATASDARKPTAFANGGIVTGPTLGLMGEYSGAKNNPEVIAPLSKLQGMLNNSGSGVIIPEVVLQGEQIKLIFDRTNRRLSRT